MRHESKLSFIKQSSIRDNFKNICKTAINKHQRWLLPTGIIKQRSSFSKRRTRSHKVWLYSCQGTKIYTWSDTRIYPRFECYLHGLPAKVVANSVILKPDVFVLLKYDEMSPSFGKIWEVLTFDKNSSCVSTSLYCRLLRFFYCETLWKISLGLVWLPRLPPDFTCIK